MGSPAILLCTMLVVRTFVASADCPLGEYTNTATQTCEPCTVCESRNLSTVTACQLQQDTLCGCPAGQYLVSASELCENCTACAAGPRTTITSCARGNARCVGLSSYGCLESLEFFNATSGTCAPCKSCTDDQYATEQCAGTRDTGCAWRCPFPDFQFFKLGYCRLNCEKCPQGKCSPTNLDACLCDTDCYDPTDKYCQHSTCTPVPPTRVATSVETVSRPRPASREEDSIPSWGIALIGLSVVTSILLFSTCLAVLCYWNRSLNRVGKHVDSTSSESGLFASEFLSSAAASTSTTSIHSSTPIPLLSNIDIFQKTNDAQGSLLGTNGHVFVSFDGTGPRLAKPGTGLRTQSKCGTMVVTAV